MDLVHFRGGIRVSRPLPLGTEAISVDPDTGAVEVYDPAMCCPTGVCGPGVDPATLQIARDLRWLQAHGIVVTRRGLAQEPEAFASNPRVAQAMAEFGDAALPLTVVNGEVLVHGRYPTRDELATALLPSAVRTGDHAVVPNACCAPGSGCC
jgi:hypothetical protein